MSDLIDKQAAIQTVLDFIVEYLGGAFDEDFQKKLMERMNDLPSTKSERQWIPCSKRLPEKIEKDYWVCTDFGYQCPCKWRKYPSKRGDFWTWHLHAHIVAWMPLPEPYRGE